MLEKTKKTKTTKVVQEEGVKAKKTVVKGAVKSDAKVIKKPVSKKIEAKTVSKSTIKDSSKNEDKQVIKTSKVKKATEKIEVKKSILKSDDKKIEKKSSIKSSIKIKRNNINLKNNINFSKIISNLEFFKVIFADIFLLFKNILHWNISKVVIYVWGIVFGLLLSLPFLVSYKIFGDKGFVDIYTNFLAGFSINNADSFFTNIIFVYESFWYLALLLLSLDFLNILYILGGLVFIFAFLYSNVLLIRVNNSYIEGKKISIKINEYFKYKKIIKFFNLTLINIVILLIPALVFGLLMGILFLVSGGMDNVQQLVASGFNNYFSIISFLILIVCVVFLTYVFYRVIFSYFVLSDDQYYNDSVKTFSFLRESFNKTNQIKKFGKFISVVFLFVVLVSPINYIASIFENNANILSDYSMYLNATEEQKSTLTSEQLYHYKGLEVQFSSLTSSNIDDKIKLNSIYMILFTIFNFVFLYGLFLMIFSSFYKRELK